VRRRRCDEGVATRLFTKLDVANRVQIAIVVHDADQS